MNEMNGGFESKKGTKGKIKAKVQIKRTKGNPKRVTGRVKSYRVEYPESNK